MSWPPSTNRQAPMALLLNRIPYASPERSVTSIEIKPDSHRFTHQILLRHEPRGVHFVLKSAVLAVVAVVAHEEIVPGRHRPLAGFDAAVGEHDEMAFGSELLESRGSARIIPQVLLRTGVDRPPLQRHGLVVDVQLVVLVHSDAVS